MGLRRIKGQTYPHKYPTLISEELFNIVQSIITGHHKTPAQYAGKPIPLRGLITCKNCDGIVTGEIQKKSTCTKAVIMPSAYAKENGSGKKFY